MRFALILVLTLTIGQKGISCECKFRDIKAELNLSKEILIGQLVKITKDSLQVKVLKTWKGQIKTDSLTIINGDGCYRKFLFPAGEHFLIYLEPSGIHICSRTIQYTKSQDIELLDSIFNHSLWINENERMTIEKLEYKRNYIIQTDKGEIDIKDKKVIYNFEGKVKSREDLPADLNDFYPLRYFLVAPKDTIFTNPCGIDYIFYVNQVHQDMIMTGKFRQKIQNKSLRAACL
jgi:hypothetical protein